MELGDDAPRYGRAPFPTDALREGPTLGTLRRVGAIVGFEDQAALVAQHLGELDGFGLRPTVEFFIQGPIDPATIPATTRSLTEALIVLEADPDTAEAGAPIAFDWRYDVERSAIIGSPAMGVQLREGTRYAAVLTTDVRNFNGESVYSVELGSLAQDPPMRWQTTSEAYVELLGLPELTDRMAGIAVFTTQYASDALVKARNVIANVAVLPPPAVSVPAPSLTFDNAAVIFDTALELDALLGIATRETTGPRDGLERWGRDNPTGLAHDNIAVVATGITTVARFVGDDTGTDGPEDETFVLAADGVPAVQSIDDIPITIVLPRRTMPAAGFPVVVFGHDLGGSRADLLALAEPLAEAGYAAVAIDQWRHGSRRDATDTQNNFGTRPGFTGTRMLADGFADGGGTAAYLEFFEGFQNISAIRDSLRQSALDQARVALLIRSNPDLAALAGPYPSTPKLDPARVAYLGQSFGSIIGTQLAAIEPSITLYVLDAPGGGLLDYIVPNSATLGELAIPRLENLYRTAGTLDRFHPLVGMLQAVLDGADSLTYARHILRDRFRIEGVPLGARHVVAIEVMNDETMPNIATEAFARGFGMYVLQPNLEVPSGLLQIASPGSANVNGQTAIVVQYEPATHGANWSAEQGTLLYQPGYPQVGDTKFPKLAVPITIDEPLYETWAQVTEILATHTAGRAPRVRSTHVPVADFDGDGTLDPQDPDPYDPTK
jgi:dienelactone hydrolase